MRTHKRGGSIIHIELNRVPVCKTVWCSAVGRNVYPVTNMLIAYLLLHTCSKTPQGNVLFKVNAVFHMSSVNK